MNSSICKHCKEEFDTSDKPKGWMANHSRWCEKNPKRKQYVKQLSKTRNEYNKKVELGILERNVSNQFIKAKELGLPVPVFSDETKKKISETNKGKTHTPEARKKISQAARNSNHRRLRKNPILYKGILMDSTWEVELAKRLDELNIEWLRPDPIKWLDGDNVTHNYFPDFYLPKYKLYLDPKNPHAYNVQKKKIKVLNSTYNIKWITSLEECQNFTI